MPLKNDEYNFRFAISFPDRAAILITGAGLGIGVDVPDAEGDVEDARDAAVEAKILPSAMPSFTNSEQTQKWDLPPHFRPRAK